MDNKFNLVMLTALVAGNMLGAGIFLLPADLAKIGSISLISWVFTTTGAFLLAIIFSRMSQIVTKNGGPYAYAQASFGDFVGFQVAFCYWVAIFVGNMALVIVLVGYLRNIFPQLANTNLSCCTGLGIIWIITLINIVGIRCVGIVQVVTTILKIIPLLLIIIVGWWFFHPGYLSSAFNIHHSTNYSAISHAASLTLWSFIGIESATIPVDSINNPRVTIPIATLLGTIIAALVYILSSTVIMGILPAHVIAQSASPFADAAQVIFGHWGRWLITGGAIISCFGALNGWVFLQGQIPMAAAQDNLFPRCFAKRSSRGVPVYSIVITSLLISSLLLISNQKTVPAQFQLIVLMATLASLIPYLYTTIAQIIKLSALRSVHARAFYFIIAMLAAFYVYWAIVSSGNETIYAGALLLFSSILLYAWVYWHKKNHSSTEE